MTASDTMDCARIELPAILDFSAAPVLLETLREAIAKGAMVTLDASHVEVLTTPCVQILLSALREPVGVSIEHESDAFISAFADMGLVWSSSPPLAGQAATDTNQTAADAPCSPITPTDQIVMTKRILTIDDSKTIRDMLKFTLVDAGFDVTQAVDGVDGVDALSKGPFDVVITDINMPNMDGYGVIRHLRATDDYKHTPILVLTTESEGDKRNLARDAGATGWMVKPFDPEALVATIYKVSP